MNALAAILGAQAAVSALSERIRQSTVELRAGPHQLGAGIAWGNGLVLTNAHVATHDRPEITNSRGVTRPGQVLARLKYEGHPPLWHLSLFVISRFTQDRKSLTSVEGWGKVEGDNPLRAAGPRRDPVTGLPDWYSARVRVIPV